MNVCSVSTRSSRGLEELHANDLRIRPATSAERLWDRCLTPQDRERLGGNLGTAFRRYGTTGMWMALRGVTTQRAVVDVAKELGFLRDHDYEWLLEEIGEFCDVEAAIDHAVTSGDFVLVERPRAAYWESEEITIDWNRNSVLWDFLWELGRHGKAGQPIDAFVFGEHAGRDTVTKRKSRLTNMPEFPVSLSDAIECTDTGTQQLELPRERIRIFQLVGLESLCEWRP